MILLVVEYSNGKVSKSTLEMTTAARGLGREGPIISCGIAHIDREPSNTFMYGRKAMSWYWLSGRPNRRQ